MMNILRSIYSAWSVASPCPFTTQQGGAVMSHGGFDEGLIFWCRVVVFGAGRLGHAAYVGLRP